MSLHWALEVRACNHLLKTYGALHAMFGVSLVASKFIFLLSGPHLASSGCVSTETYVIDYRFI